MSVEPLELRKRAAWLDACAIRLEQLDVARLMRRYADEARARALLMEARPDRAEGRRHM